MKQLYCNDLGYKCDRVLTAKTEERLVDLAAIHLRDGHHVSAITPDTVATIKNKIINYAATDAAEVVDRIFEKYNCSSEPECTWRYIGEAEMILRDTNPLRGRTLRAA